MRKGKGKSKKAKDEQENGQGGRGCSGPTRDSVFASSNQKAATFHKQQ